MIICGARVMALMRSLGKRIALAIAVQAEALLTAFFVLNNYPNCLKSWKQNKE